MKYYKIIKKNMSPEIHAFVPDSEQNIALQKANLDLKPKTQYEEIVDVEKKTADKLKALGVVLPENSFLLNKTISGYQFPEGSFIRDEIMFDNDGNSREIYIKNIDISKAGEISSVKLDYKLSNLGIDRILLPKFHKEFFNGESIVFADTDVLQIVLDLLVGYVSHAAGEINSDDFLTFLMAKNILIKEKYPEIGDINFDKIMNI